jgi:hypothetical protein
MKFKFLFTLIGLFILTLYATGQPGGGPGGPIEPPLIPIDGGASILLAAGALFGAKKIYDTTKRKK